ncbi:MAG: anti-anti-sigma factor [Gammaproteobacteria bacterium]|nr:MAG: anti-anti-sigma factor [Gammaproteobacteria bacterium]
MSVTSNTVDGICKIKIAGRFDFSLHQAFRGAYERVEGSESYEIDMAATSYLDSSALGMLLLLRDFAGGDTAKVSIINANDDIKKILKISNFEQLFQVG